MQSKKVILSLALTSLLGTAAFLPDLTDRQLSWLRRADPKETCYSGFVEAYAFTVASEVAGRLQALPVREGASVAEGTVIAQLDGTYAELRLRQAEAVVATARAESRGGEVAQAERSLDMARWEWERHTIRTWRGGTVQRIHVQQGQTVAPGAPIATLMDRKELKVRVYVPADALPCFSPEGKVHVSVGKEVYAGRVEQISDQEEFSPLLNGGAGDRRDLVFAVNIAIQEGWERLRPGMPVQVTPVGRDD
ncbi:HlyD family efflux transporter periplasmic adaptor subunit [Heliobacterium gestii]|uniref:HlyD family efflux transporter periplasmic adaptor subunit n=1 Tax=Heliomicrobium gestii TaxID=2699 RepID=A0A845L4F9_HELGE|nr:biotin/lipoyl-binding protein [Heliomicrobium gestii]MBM7865194.1 multidrug resistance efflux pump [Heliomicrobium gestii]MZP41462.1 HlyD family efflux transporter periplasmic adaptor subunit [Heliomicrobium gestii]